METTDKINFLATLLPLVGVIFIIALGVVVLTLQFRKNLYRQKLKQEELVTAHRQELLRSSILAQEEERKSIAMDLHDELGAVLSITRMHLVALEKQGRTDEGQLASLQNIRALVENSISTVRRISHNLMPQNLQVSGLGDILRRIAGMVDNRSGVQIHIHSSEDLKNLPWAVNLGFYRICLELVNNTLKHARARNIHVRVRADEGWLVLQYTDDGIGMQETRGRDGLGQKSMEARVVSMGGSFEAGNREEGGFYALIRIPYSPGVNAPGQ